MLASNLAEDGANIKMSLKCCFVQSCVTMYVCPVDIQSISTEIQDSA